MDFGVGEFGRPSGWPFGSTGDPLLPGRIHVPKEGKVKFRQIHTLCAQTETYDGRIRWARSEKALRVSLVVKWKQNENEVKEVTVVVPSK